MHAGPDERAARRSERPYDDVFELGEINRDFRLNRRRLCDRRQRRDQPGGDVERAKTVLFVKRSMAFGYAGVENELFYRDNTIMLSATPRK